MRHFWSALCFAILLLQAPLPPVEEPETTCAASAAQLAFAPDPSAEAVSLRLTLFQRFRIFRHRTAHTRRVLVPAASN